MCWPSALVFMAVIFLAITDVALVFAGIWLVFQSYEAIYNWFVGVAMIVFGIRMLCTLWTLWK